MPGYASLSAFCVLESPLCLVCNNLPKWTLRAKVHCLLTRRPCAVASKWTVFLHSHFHFHFLFLFSISIVSAKSTCPLTCSIPVWSLWVSAKHSLTLLFGFLLLQDPEQKPFDRAAGWFFEWYHRTWNPVSVHYCRRFSPFTLPAII